MDVLQILLMFSKRPDFQPAGKSNKAFIKAALLHLWQNDHAQFMLSLIYDDHAGGCPYKSSERSGSLRCMLVGFHVGGFLVLRRPHLAGMRQYMSLS